MKITTNKLELNLAGIFLPIYSKLDIDTAYHYLELRFQSKGLRVLGAVMFIIYQVGRMSIIMYLPCMVLGNLTGISVNLLIVIMGVIAIIYSYTGGLKSVLWTDFIQGSVLLIGVTCGLFFLLAHIDGGIGAIFHEFANNGKFLAADQPLFNPNILKDSVFLLIVGAVLIHTTGTAPFLRAAGCLRGSKRCRYRCRQNRR